MRVCVSALSQDVCLLVTASADARITFLRSWPQSSINNYSFLYLEVL